LALKICIDPLVSISYCYWSFGDTYINRDGIAIYKKKNDTGPTLVNTHVCGLGANVIYWFILDFHKNGELFVGGKKKHSKHLGDCN
jgi:hypothetical protein